jgi:phosphatidyl-myo-inositol alpha-mannosyltransferase
MRVGLVAPYPWDVPGGVVAHVRDLAETLISLGHEVSVIAPVDSAGDEEEGAPLPDYVVRAGRTVPIPFNGSVSRLVFGPVSATRVRRWIHDGKFDVLHLHSPETLSLPLLALFNARGPMVATFHAANPRSRLMAMLQSPLQVQLEKLNGRIAVSPAARKTIVEHLGGDAVLIPNGVHVERFATAQALPGWPPAPGALGFVGRVDEPRKGLSVLFEALALLARSHPGVQLLVAGPGEAGDVPAGVTLLGQVSEQVKAQVFRSVDVFVAPNTGGESFGIILLEAMAAGTPIVASDIDAFRRVLGDGAAGALATVSDPASFAHACAALLESPARRHRLAEAGRAAVARYDWSVVAAEIVHVYDTAIAMHTGGVVAEPEPVIDQPLGAVVDVDPLDLP